MTKIYFKSLFLFVLGTSLLFNTPKTFAAQDIEYESLGNPSQALDQGRGVNKIARFQLKNKTQKALEVTEITLKNTGTIDLGKNYQSLQIRNHQEKNISTSATLNGQSVFFQINPLTINPGESINLSVWARMSTPFQKSRTLSFEFESVKSQMTKIKAKKETMASIRRGERTPQQLTTRKGVRKGLLNKKLQAEEPYTTRIKLQYSVKANKIVLALQPGSVAKDKDANGIDNEPLDFQKTFDHFTLWIDGQSAAISNNITQDSQGQLWLTFEGEFYLAREHVISVTTERSALALNGDRAILLLQESFSFPDNEKLKGHY